MSKDFDTTLSDAIDLAAAAAQTAGASAARARGRKRTMRKRIAVCTASAVLVAGGATAAFALSSPHGGAPQKTAVSPSASASQSPSPAATSGPSSSPSVGAKPPVASNSPSSSPAVATDPHQVVAAAWLTPDQLPFAGTFHWKAVQAMGQSLNATVSYVPKDTVVQAITVCGDPAQLLGRTIGAQVASYFAPPDGSGSSAVQQIFFFSDAASAQQAFGWLQSQYGPSCMANGVTITKTAGDGQNSAVWLSRKGTSLPPDMAPYNREYFVQRGSTIAYVSISTSNSSLPTAYNDAAQLSIIAAHLCVYGGPCN